MKLLIALVAVLVIAFNASAQPSLKPHIGLAVQPQAADSICPIPLYLGEFDDSGYEVGDTVNDFTLFNLTGDSLRLSTALQNNKPKLFISSSYTCPVFRNRVPQINDLVNVYGSYVDVYIVYTVEAHPDSNISPYFGYVAVNNQNIDDGILYSQPATYGEREAMVQDMFSDLVINAPVFIDGPCNKWWQHYGPAPNNATLIDANGIVKEKHGWFNQFPNNMRCDIDSLLGLSLTDCSTGNNNGSFTFTMISADTIYGGAGATLSLEAELTNTGTNNVIVDIKRSQESIPTDWGTALCLDVCYPAAVDTAWVVLYAGTSKTFHFYFFTDAAGFGGAEVKFRNREHPNNIFIQRLYASTSVATTALQNVTVTKPFVAYPSPTAGLTHVNKTPVWLYNSVGQLILYSTENTLDISSFRPGLYVVVCDGQYQMIVKQ